MSEQPHRLGIVQRNRASGTYRAICSCGELVESADKDQMYEGMADHIMQTPLFRSLVLNEQLRKRGLLN